MKTQISVSKDVRNEIDRKIFGNFIEHIEHCILYGICDPQNPLSNEDGIRVDVLEKCRELNPPILRFPGGTVIGIYHWEDHVGPIEQRKKGRNLIWGERLCHEFGTAEYIKFCREIGAEPMLCVNMPTGSAEEAANWVEYCNGTEDTYYANLRRSHGYEEPFNVKYWCIGNESSAEPDLGWQHDVNIYIREAWEFTKYMKLTDPTIKLVFVSGNEEWNRAVLDSLFPVCDYFSVHMYSGLPDYDRVTKFENVVLPRYRSLLNEYNQKPMEFSLWYRFPPRQDDIKLAVDEWGLWSRKIPTEGSKYGLARRYDWKCALWVAKYLNTLIRNSDMVGIANMAQMVNVIAPIISEPQGSFKQTVFYPMRDYPKHCGTYLSAVEYDCEDLDVVSTVTADGACVLFAVNTSSSEIEIEVNERIQTQESVYCEELTAVNHLEQDHVLQSIAHPDSYTAKLMPYSISVLHLA